MTAYQLTPDAHLSDLAFLIERVLGVFDLIARMSELPRQNTFSAQENLSELADILALEDSWMERCPRHFRGTGLGWHTVGPRPFSAARLYGRVDVLMDVGVPVCVVNGCMHGLI